MYQLAKKWAQYSMVKTILILIHFVLVWLDLYMYIIGRKKETI